MKRHLALLLLVIMTASIISGTGVVMAKKAGADGPIVAAVMPAKVRCWITVEDSGGRRSLVPGNVNPDGPIICNLNTAGYRLDFGHPYELKPYTTYQLQYDPFTRVNPHHSREILIRGDKNTFRTGGNGVFLDPPDDKWTWYPLTPGASQTLRNAWTNYPRSVGDQGAFYVVERPGD